MSDSEDRYRQLIEVSPTAMLVVNDADGIVFANRAALTLYGAQSADELIGRNTVDLIHPDDRGAIMERRRDVLQGHRPPISEDAELRFDGRRLRLDGSVFLSESRGIQMAWEGVPSMLLIIQNITERKQTEDALRRTQFSLDRGGDAVFWIREDGGFEFVNEVAERLLGYGRDELSKMHLWDVDPNLSQAEWPEVWARLGRRQDLYTFETVHLAKDGRPIPVEVTTSLSSFNDRRMLCSSSRDITKRKETEDALRESEQRYRNLAELSPDGIMVHTDGVIVFANSSLARMLGAKSPDELIGRRGIDFAAPEEHQNILDDRKRVSAGDSEFVEEIRVIRLDGSEIYLERVMSIVEWYGQLSFLVIFRDNKERRIAEQALRESERRYRSLFEESDLGIQIGSRRSGRIFANRACLEMFGYASYEEMSKLPPTGIVSEYDRERVLKYTQELHSGRRESATYEFDGKRKDGSVVPVQAFARRIIWDGEPVIQRTFIDLTERKRAEAQLRQAQKMDAVGQLTGGIAHEFNNLLMVIVGNLEMVSDRIADDLGRKAVSLAMKGALRAAELTNQLLAFSRKQELKVENIDMNSLVRGMREMLQRALGETVVVSTRLSQGIWSVAADKGLLETVLLNLSLNARDAMPDGGEIVITTANRTIDSQHITGNANAVSGEFVLLQVADTGTGIAPADLDHVFEPFFTTKEVGKGTGLGLSMVHGFVEQSGGFIDVESHVGRGTRFRVYLPRATEMSVPAETDREGTTRVTQFDKRILVIEDEPEVRRIVVNTLSQLGCTIIEAEDGETALSRIREAQDIDLLFTDVVLPRGMNGFQIANEAHKMIPGLKVIFTSGYPDGELEGLGSDGTRPWFIRKPYRKAEIAELLEKVLRP